MTIQPLTGILIGAVFLVTVVVMVGWHVLSGGVWRRWAAGRAIMGLLATQSAITLLATASSFFPGFPGRAAIYIAVYFLLIFSMGWVGWTIWSEHAKGSSEEDER